MGASAAVIRYWGAARSIEECKRAMTPTARRLPFVLLVPQRERHNLDAFRSVARWLEREYLDEDA